ncbi:MAG: LysM peptidoglycan-binding domain-containing protein [Chloroflexota bacterium]|nr:LysM peptidoglycan-binding domain-containing protein [Chloroflexota bacterium]
MNLPLKTLPRFVTWLVVALVVIGGAGVLWAQDDAPALEGEIVYTVQVADTLDSIGAFFDVKVECIAELNELEDINEILVGQELVISAACPRYGGLDVVVNPREDASPAFGLQTGGDSGQGGGGDQVWVVGINDTLDTIGQALNVSVVAIQIANELEDGAILSVGQELIIPADAPAYGQFPALTGAVGEGQGGGGAAGSIYVVQPGDTLDLIALGLNVQVACVAEANALPDINVITPGLALLIPADCPEYDGLSTP